MSNFFLVKLFAADAGRALSSAEPQAAFAELARRCPVHRAPDGAVVVTRIEDVTAITTRPDVRGPGALGPSMMAERPLPPLDVDGAEYSYYRRLLNPLFSASCTGST